MVTRTEIDGRVEFHMDVVEGLFYFEFMFPPYKAPQVGRVGAREKGYGFEWH
jgi:hypothetical protein